MILESSFEKAKEPSLSLRIEIILFNGHWLWIIKTWVDGELAAIAGQSDSAEAALADALECRKRWESANKS